MILLDSKQVEQLGVLHAIIAHSQLLLEAYDGLPEQERESVEQAYLQSLRNGQMEIQDEPLLNILEEKKR